MSPKIVTVFGATGYQGRSVVDSLVANKSADLSVRAITRNPDSDKAKELRALGAEVVKADGLDYASLVTAFQGSWAVFANTNSHDASISQPDGPTEVDLGKKIVDAAFEAGVQIFTYSGFEAASKITNGAVSNEAFDNKAAVTEYAKTRGFKSAVAVSPGWYLENHLSEELAPAIGGFPFTADEEGQLTLRVPRWGGDDKIPFIGIGDDYGDLVHGVLLSPEEYNGRLVQGVSVAATAHELTAEFEKVTGKKARWVEIPDWRDFATFDVPELEVVKYMFGFCQHAEGKYYGVPNDVVTAGKLKGAAAAAKGLSGTDAELLTLEKFWRKYFA